MNYISEAIVGKKGVYSRTVSESDVYLFGGVSGDLHFVHFNEEYMKGTVYKHRIAHGILILAYMSTAGGRMNENEGWETVSYGYDKVRFIKPVFIGDTITAEYIIARVDVAESKYYAEVTCKNQSDELVAVATHISRFINEKE